jgi:thiol-disulfide isomerase/thioredoxin
MSDLIPDRATPLAPGTPAPGFQLNSTPNEKIALSDFAGRPVVLAFYPADWSPVCTDQMVLYQELMPEFQRFDAGILGISVDGVWCHNAFARHRNIRERLRRPRSSGGMLVATDPSRHDGGVQQGCERRRRVERSDASSHRKRNQDVA